MGALAVYFEAFGIRTDRQQPVAAHEPVIVHALDGMVMKGVAGAFLPAGPQQDFVIPGKTVCVKAGHGVGFNPHHIVQNPVADLLQDGPDAVDIEA